MPNAPAQTGIITYAVWFRLATADPRRISYILDELSNSVASTYRLFSDNPNAKHFQDLYWIGDDFCLMHIEEHCSPGDICGFIRGKKLIDGAEEVMAVRIDQPDYWYLPHQGLLDRNAQAKLRAWQDQVSDWYYEQRAQPVP